MWNFKEQQGRTNRYTGGRVAWEEDCCNGHTRDLSAQVRKFQTPFKASKGMIKDKTEEFWLTSKELEPGGKNTLESFMQEPAMGNNPTMTQWKQNHFKWRNCMGDAAITKQQGPWFHPSGIAKAYSICGHQNYVPKDLGNQEVAKNLVSPRSWHTWPHSKFVVDHWKM